LSDCARRPRGRCAEGGRKGLLDVAENDGRGGRVAGRESMRAVADTEDQGPKRAEHDTCGKRGTRERLGDHAEASNGGRGSSREGREDRHNPDGEPRLIHGRMWQRHSERLKCTAIM
jgi:hypothetical protein